MTAESFLPHSRSVHPPPLSPSAFRDRFPATSLKSFLLKSLTASSRLTWLEIFRLHFPWHVDPFVASTTRSFPKASLSFRRLLSVFQTLPPLLILQCQIPSQCSPSSSSHLPLQKPVTSVLKIMGCRASEIQRDPFKFCLLDKLFNSHNFHFLNFKISIVTTSSRDVSWEWRGQVHYKTFYWLIDSTKNKPTLDPLGTGMATHSSILAWRIPWTEEPGGLQSMWLQRVRHNWATNIFTFFSYYSHYVQGFLNCDIQHEI